MRIAILSCGPSILSTWKNNVHDYDKIIAVNHSAFLLPFYIDWWVVGDMHQRIFETSRIFPKEGYVIDDRGIRFVHNFHPMTYILTHRNLYLGNNLSDNRMYSGVSSLLLLSKFSHVKSVDIFGMDLVGTQHFFGNVHEPSVNERWKREIPMINNAKALLHKMFPGIVFNHIYPEPSPKVPISVRPDLRILSKAKGRFL